jgi:hypothetical protein
MTFPFLKGQPMRTCCVLLFLLCAQAGAQTLVVEGGGVSPGKYYIEVVVGPGGQIAGQVITSMVKLSGAPTPPPPPIPPASKLGKAACDSLALVTDVNKDYNATVRAAIYEEIEKHIGVELKKLTGPKPWQDVAAATKAATERIFSAEVNKAWFPWSAAIGAELKRMEEAGELATYDQMKNAFRDIVNGLQCSPNEARKPISPEMRDLIIQIIKMILEILLKMPQQPVPPPDTVETTMTYLEPVLEGSVVYHVYHFVTEEL